ncbi:MAG: DNA alkylation repair protein [bacterium]|nr:DNA alkylation repair protein [bacterium]
MPEQLKNIFFSRESINSIAELVGKFYPDFDGGRFVGLVFDEDWESKELKERMRHMTQCMHETLPLSYPDAIEILKKVAPFVKGFEGMVFPDFVELNGQEEWEVSLEALGYFTSYSSSEFAIRPFLDRDPERVMGYMLAWAGDEDPGVRRFASEGCRPRLPWAMALPKFKKDPSLILPVLETLKDDPSEFVRKSVANNLNDISKDHPELMLDISEKWYGKSKNTDWIVKHACRTLLKAGNKRAMMLFGFADPANVGVENLETGSGALKIGENMVYSFDLRVKGNGKSLLRLEYAVYFMKANGKLSRKVFKITENNYKPGIHSFAKRHSFKNLSTRKHYPGEHRIGIIVNGVEMAAVSFQLEM